MLCFRKMRCLSRLLLLTGVSSSFKSLPCPSFCSKVLICNHCEKLHYFSISNVSGILRILYVVSMKRLQLHYDQHVYFIISLVISSSKQILLWFYDAQLEKEYICIARCRLLILQLKFSQYPTIMYCIYVSRADTWGRLGLT